MEATAALKWKMDAHLPSPNSANLIFVCFRRSFVCFLRNSHVSVASSGRLRSPFLVHFGMHERRMNARLYVCARTPISNGLTLESAGERE